MIVSGMSLQTLAILVGSVVALRAAQLFLDFRRLLQSIHHLPGYRRAFSSEDIISSLLPRMPLLTLGRDHKWLLKHTPFAERGLDIISSVGFWPKARASLWVADPDVIQDIVWSRGRFSKPIHRYRILTVFGDNIVSAEGDHWKRYRKIVASMFSERNNVMVCNAAARTMVELFETLWAGKNEIVVDHSVDLTLPIALFVIGAAGFGRSISWKEDDAVPPGHQLTFKDALHSTLDGLYVKLIVPTWAMGFTKRFRHTRLAFDELQLYLTEMVQERKVSPENAGDLLSNLLAANDDESSNDQVKLTTSELFGNIFILMVAGHETTAHSLSFAFALLALHPDNQEELYEQVKQVLPDGRIPTYDDLPSLTYASAVFNETLRMFPPVVEIPKASVEDTTLTLNGVNGMKRTVDVPRGMDIALYVPGLHYNPKCWEDPYTFKPERFLGEWNRDAFLPFSAGYRGCVGRKFTETEAAVVLSLMVSRYTISIKDEEQFVGESLEQRKARILRAHNAITLTPTRVPLVFRRRV